MSGNSFGHTLVLTTFGESHGPAVGGVLDGLPPGIEIDLDFIQSELARRSPGIAEITSSRHETDRPEILSGVYEGRSTGTPIAFIIYNRDQRPEDYAHLRDVFRPSHADFTYFIKYGIRDHRGGGRASARETVARVVGGALAKLFLKKYDILIAAYASRIGTVSLPAEFRLEDPGAVLSSPVGCPEPKTSRRMMKLLEELKKEGDTTGGVISCVIRNVPAGLGEPVFDKLHAGLAKAMMSINAVKGFEYGMGFEAASMKGSAHNDRFVQQNKKIFPSTNHDGGIQGGISNGQEIPFRVAFKPIATLMKDQHTVNSKGEKVLLQGKGRHDVCVIPRAIPVVEAMAALVIGDHMIRQGLR